VIRRLLLLNGLAILGAVVNHSTGWGFTALFWWTDRYQPVSVPDFSQVGSASYYALRAMEQSIMFAIPAFLFVSGFFVAFATERQRNTVGWEVIRSRVWSLLVPYLVWSAVIFSWRGLEGTIDAPLGYLTQILLGRAAEPYYYVPLLIQFLLISPLLVPLVRKHWKPVLLIAGVAQFVVHAARYPVILGWDLPLTDHIVRYSPGFAVPQTIFWFVFGIFAGSHLPLLKSRLAHWKKVLPVLTIVLGLLALVEWELLFRHSGAQWLPPAVTALDSFYAGAFILTFLAWEKARLPFAAPLERLGAMSFGVYLVHAPVLELVSRTAYHAVPWMLGHQILHQPALLASGVAVPLLMMALMNRSPVRAQYRFVFG
jgi:probable poly-beta-1,6-N-acetyl-D-glucosamine export protein